MRKALVVAALVVATAGHAAELRLGDLLKNLFGNAQAASSADLLPAGNPDASIASGIYVLKDRHGSHVYKIKDIGNGRALIAYDGESGDRNTSGDSFAASLGWAVATAGGATWAASHAENNRDFDCRIRFVAHARSINLQEHDCTFAGMVSPPRDAILKFAGPLKGDEFADAEKTLGLSALAAVRSGSPAAPSSSLVGRTFKGPNAVLDQFKNTQTLDFGGDGLSRRVVHVGEAGGEKHVIVLMNRGSDWIVSADMAITTATRELNFVGTNDESEYAPGMRCAVDGRKVEAFGFMRQSGTTFSSVNPALVWLLDTTGHPMPVKGGRVICR